ncbi:hypothetical protein SPI_08773 [Niveomyces insectorum RCEF 264]|uniref:Carboxymuconolactone decarboxylase n=1 Tax=Niveomyces insectorum RCEF 264 TaxID=1081102 RepID=A0A167MM54_9HYPO|nr:hypothetical protein SPI_08773 [Niveomyces insectorum RCEF 264]
MASWDNKETTDKHLLPYVDAEAASPAVKTAMQSLPLERNIFKASLVLSPISILAHSTVNFPAFMGLLTKQWHEDRKLRSSDWQTAVLRTAAVLDAPYEWEVNEPVARVFGFSDAQLAALRDPRTPLPAALFSPRRRLIASAIEELSSAENRIGVATLDELKTFLSPEEILELLYLHGVYSFLARVMRSVQVDSDGEIPGVEDTLRKYNAAAIEKEKQYRD